MSVLALTRIDVANYLQTLLTVYIVLIIIRILMSYFQRVPYNRYLHAAMSFVTDVTDPFLNLFRRFIPPVRIGPGAIDLSPMIAIFVLSIVGGIIVNLVAG